MARLIYMAIASLDGYIEDSEGRFDWAEPDEEVHSFINESEASAGTYLYGRRMYQTMAAWDADPKSFGDSPFMQKFAEIWQAADKVVYSRSLEKAPTSRTRLERVFNPDDVRAMKASAERDLVIGGPALAANAFEAGLVDEVRLYVSPIVLGGGKAALPQGIRLPLRLQKERRFRNGMVYLDYAAAANQRG